MRLPLADFWRLPPDPREGERRGLVLFTGHGTKFRRGR